MFWFDGSIRNAVDKVKSSGVLFLVFIKGNDKLSNEYDLKLNEESKFKPQEFIAIKIEDDSVAFQHFQQIYVKVPVPSVFLIKSNGIPLKVVASGSTADLFDAIHVAIKSQSLQQKNKISEDNGGQHIWKSEINSLEETVSKISHPRSVGCLPPELSDCKQYSVTEEEIKKRLSEIRSFPRFLLIDNCIPVHNSFPNPVPRTQSARIQFRFPNDDVLSWEFPDMSTLHDIRVYLMEKVNLSPDFKLLRVFPRTNFTSQDYHKTLKDLSLTPSGTLLIVPVQDKTVQAKFKNIIAQPSFALIILKTLLLPFLTALKYFKKHVLGIQDESNIRPEKLASETAIEKILNKKTSTSNIHGFQFDEDSDFDVEHPDNGNSTQQRYEK